MARLKVKNWNDYQHYKDRAPAWIKLHKKLLDDYVYQSLQLASKALAPMFWLLASESDDGSIEYDLPALAFRLRVKESVVQDSLTELISKGFFIPDSDMLATPEHDASLEKEKRKRREEKKGGAAAPFVLPEWIPIEPWTAYLEMRKANRKVPTERAKTLVVRELDKLRAKGEEPGAVLDQSTANNWTDVYPLKDKSARVSPTNGASNSSWKLDDVAIEKKAKEVGVSTHGLIRAQAIAKIEARMDALTR